MPKLVKTYITQVLLGFALAAGFVAMLLHLNVANLAYLVTHTEGGYLAVFMLWVFNGIVFAGVQFGIYIMMLARDDTPRGGRRAPLHPVPVEAEAIVRPGRARDLHG